MIKQISNIRVRYADTDQMKVVYHGKLFEYFEEARTELFRGIGVLYTEVEKTGFFLQVIEAHAAYKGALRFDDLLQVVTILKDLPVVRLRIDYEVYREGGTDMLAEGYTVHSFVNASTGKPTRVPAQVLEQVEKSFAKGKS